MKNDDVVCLKLLIKAVAELNQTYGSLNIFNDEFKDAGLDPLLNAIGFILFGDQEEFFWDNTIGKLFDTWDDPEYVESYLDELIALSDKSKRNYAYENMKLGQLLLLDNKLELL